LGELRAAGYAEFFVGVLQVMFDGPRGERELGGDLVAGEAAGGQHRHLAFAGGEGRGRGGRHEGRRASALALAGQGAGVEFQLPGPPAAWRQLKGLRVSAGQYVVEGDDSLARPLLAVRGIIMWPLPILRMTRAVRG
jgi:hypothetical protein